MPGGLMPGAPRSTYRLQIRRGFDLYAAADVCDYLASLGVGAVYLSPLLPSTRGSDHGYDVVGWDTVDPQRGGVDGWTRYLAAARSRRLGTVVDIVPNHAGVEDPTQNAAWWDVLRLGPSSPYAHWFDIDWTDGRVRLPVLGDDATADEFAVDGAELHYYDHRFPLAPGTEDGTPAEVHDRQHYELVDWRRADTDQNYRRFFAVTTLAGLRVEDAAVFAATHEQIGRWVRDDAVDGVRVDHPDGLADPAGYLRQLRELVGERTWLTVEKILEPGETLPHDWPVDGTTGYDALGEVCGVFVDPSAERAFSTMYEELTGDGSSCEEHVARGKREIVTSLLQAEVNRIARLAPGVALAAETVAELAVAFAVYRSYMPDGAGDLARAVATVDERRPDLSDAVAKLTPRLSDPADELCTRFQQLSGAVMAKGVEDTAYYRYSRFVALNEVGGDAGRFGLEPSAFHAAQNARASSTPLSMTTLSTHDTKRGEDVRARLAVLAEVPDDWRHLATQVMAEAPLPDRPFAYLLWQTIVGAGFIARDRMHAYAEKAMREAAVSTTWSRPDEAFETAVHAVVDRAYDDPSLHGPLAAFIERITPGGWSNSLGQKLVQLTAPGVPDVYQGTELWEDSLVDPDNRRPVEFAARAELLARLDADGAPPAVDDSGAAKLWVTSRALRLRRDRPELFDGYAPLFAQGPSADHVVAFDRGGAVTVATRLPVTLTVTGGWRSTSITLYGGTYTDVLTGRRFAGDVALTDLLASYPVALLVR